MRILAILPWFMAFMFGGCAAYQAGKAAAGVAESQRGGSATGAGATLTAPNNSAAPSVQVAKEHVRYFPPPAPSPISPAPREQPMVISLPPAEGTTPAVEPVVPPAAPAYVPMVAEIERTTTTTLGEHQNAEGLMKVAVAASKRGINFWVGILTLLAGIVVGGYSVVTKADDDYPLVAIGLTGVGVLLLVLPPNPFWSLLVIGPLAFYGVQKLGLWKFPGA